MKSGDFGLIATSDIFGRLIRLVTGGSVNHAFIVVNDSIIEMQPSGVKLSPIDQYGPKTIWVTVPLPPLSDEARQLVVQAAQGLYQRQVRYSFKDIAAQLLYRTFHVRPRWLAEFISSTKSMVCSQSVDWCYSQAGVQLFNDGRLPGLVAPSDLLTLAKQNGWVNDGSR
jgi:hypothetical protein